MNDPLYEGWLFAERYLCVLCILISFSLFAGGFSCFQASKRLKKDSVDWVFGGIMLSLAGVAILIPMSYFLGIAIAVPEFAYDRSFYSNHHKVSFPPENLPSEVPAEQAEQETP